MRFQVGKEKINLNDYAKNDYCAETKARISVHFKDLESILMGYIIEAEAVVGCLAWFTSHPLLTALADKRGVSIVVQKEDFLRPDLDHSAKWHLRLRGAYEALPPLTLKSEELNPVRCLGICNGERNRPLMHHKFLVFCEVVRVGGRDEVMLPYAVWTGSYNPTANATHSFENGIYIESEEIAGAFHREWRQVVELSEPLDWSDGRFGGWRG